MSNGRKAAGKSVILSKHICMKLLIGITDKQLKCFFKGDRGGLVDDFGAQRVLKFRSLVRNGKLFDVSSTKRQTI